MNINGNGIKNKNQERWLSFSFWCNIYKVFYFFLIIKKKKKILKIQLNFQIRPKLKFVTIIILNQ